jgi:transcriptional regulator
MKTYCGEVMYVPEHFAENDPDVLRQWIARYPLGSLVTFGQDGLDANQVIFEMRPSSEAEGDVLTGHVARANPVWQSVQDGEDVLVIFKSDDAYVSPNWYPSKQATHRQVPTWNYQVVNVHGKIRIIQDEKSMRAIVARLTHTHEMRTNPAQAWRMGQAPKDYIDQLMQAIVGVEIRITKMVGKSKLSQNKAAIDRLGIAQGLAQQGEVMLSKTMLANDHD